MFVNICTKIIQPIKKNRREENMKKVEVPIETLEFLLDKVQECYKKECKKIVARILKGE